MASCSAGNVSPFGLGSEPNFEGADALAEQHALWCAQVFLDQLLDISEGFVQIVEQRRPAQRLAIEQQKEGLDPGGQLLKFVASCILKEQGIEGLKRRL